jgi:hypothetical protein
LGVIGKPSPSNGFEPSPPRGRADQRAQQTRGDVGIEHYRRARGFDLARPKLSERAPG